MEQYLIRMIALRRVEPREMQDVLLHIDKANGDQIWLLTLSGKRRLIEDLNKYDPDRWKRFAEAGLVYVLWGEEWAFSPELDAKTKLPVLMEPFDEAYRKLTAANEPAPPAPAPTQLTLNEQPAGDPGPTPST